MFYNLVHHHGVQILFSAHKWLVFFLSSAHLESQPFLFCPRPKRVPPSLLVIMLTISQTEASKVNSITLAGFCCGSRSEGYFGEANCDPTCRKNETMTANLEETGTDHMGRHRSQRATLPSTG